MISYFLADREQDECPLLIKEFDNLCASLGVPLAVEKEEGPVSKLICLGLRIDTEEIKIYIPEEKICKLKIQLNHALTRNKITLKELQSLAGSLAFCSKAFPLQEPLIEDFMVLCLGSRNLFIL